MNVKFKVGAAILNGTTEYVILAQKEKDVLLLRKNSGEIVVAHGFLQKSDGTYEWDYGNYYGSYMNTVLEIFCTCKNQDITNDDMKIARVDSKIAGFLDTCGYHVFDTPLKAFATSDAVYRIDELLNNENYDLPANLLGTVQKEAAEQLGEYLTNDESAMNYDAMDNIVEKIIMAHCNK